MFSEADEERLRGFPEIGLDELIQFFTLTRQDQAFVQAYRGGANRLGVAVQLCTLPWMGVRAGRRGHGTPGGGEPVGEAAQDRAAGASSLR